MTFRSPDLSAPARSADAFGPARATRAMATASPATRAAFRSVAFACVRWPQAFAARSGRSPQRVGDPLASGDFTNSCASFTQTASAVSRVLVAAGPALSEAERVRSRPSWRAFTRQIGS